jgi:hypothetical protein
MDERFDTTKTCSLCGNQGRHDIRYAAIVARTHYEGKWERKHVATGGVAIWELHICPICMPRARLSHADREIRSARSTALAGMAAFLAGIASIVISNLTHQHYHLFQHHRDLAEDVITGQVSGMEMMFLLAVGLALTAGH